MKHKLTYEMKIDRKIEQKKHTKLFYRGCLWIMNYESKSSFTLTFTEIYHFENKGIKLIR